MKKEQSILKQIVFAATLTIFAACGDNSTEKKATTTNKETTKDSAKPAPAATPTETVNNRPPIINITDTVSPKRLVVYIKDSAANFGRISLKLGEIYGFKLAALVKKTGIKPTGQPMAWYNNMSKAPYFFEAGFPVDKKPSKLPANIHVREMSFDSATVAHFYGPYEMLGQGYDALKDILKSRKKKLSGKPYEIYIDDPMDKDGKMKDPYKVQTDIVFPWK